jgi:hypothetical protein
MKKRKKNVFLGAAPKPILKVRRFTFERVFLSSRLEASSDPVNEAAPLKMDSTRNFLFFYFLASAAFEPFNFGSLFHWSTNGAVHQQKGMFGLDSYALRQLSHAATDV